LEEFGRVGEEQLDLVDEPRAVGFALALADAVDRAQGPLLPLGRTGPVVPSSG
jgi:hypothetical protein